MAFCVMCVFILIESVMLYQKSTENLVKERSMLVSSKCQDIASNMNILSQQTFEIMRSVINNHEDIWSENKGKRLFELQDVSAVLRDKIILYPAMEFIYVYSPDSFMTSRKQADVRGSEKIALSEFLKHSAKNMGAYPATGKWILCNVQNVDYCGIIYRYQDRELYVGTFIRADHLFDGLNEQFLEFHGQGQITSTDGFTYQVGDNQMVMDTDVVLMDDQDIFGGLKLTGKFRLTAFDIFYSNVLALILGILLMSLFSLFQQRLMIKKYILKPIQALSDSVKKADEEDLSHLKIPRNAQITEIETLENTLNYLMNEVVATRMELYEQKIQKQNMQLKELRAQLSPHFYLNAIMTASSLTYQNRNEETREYLSQLSTYMRYMMRITDSLVSLGEVLSHVENYVRMQEIRFPDSIVLLVDCPEDLKTKKIPHLLLHTIVENVFKHAMNLTETLMLMISCRKIEQEDFYGFEVVVEDSGKGFTEAQITQYNEGEANGEEADLHIGLFNVKKSLQLRYGREDLFHISNAIPHGARVEIRIPEERSKN